MGRYILAIGLLLAALAVGSTLMQQRTRSSASPATSAARPPAVPALRGKPAPNFELPDLKGSKGSAADFKNKVLLVNFWATWCAPCIVEIPWFVEFQQKYGPQGLQVIGISLDETGSKDVQLFVEKYKMAYPVLMGDESTAELFGGILGLPTTFIVDRDGKYYSMHRGLVNREALEEELQTVLGTPSQSAPAATEKPPASSAPAPAPRADTTKS
ncbi:MAG: TlpA family protein disulfide reductase [Acidobacteria bacterium]|nr:TlpA family protein disulfide reductase [Acidobacteriota bacterium]